MGDTERCKNVLSSQLHRNSASEEQHIRCSSRVSFAPLKFYGKPWHRNALNDSYIKAFLSDRIVMPWNMDGCSKLLHQITANFKSHFLIWKCSFLWLGPLLSLVTYPTILYAPLKRSQTLIHNPLRSHSRHFKNFEQFRFVETLTSVSWQR